MSENNNSIKNSILEAVDKGRLKMRPRWHFVFKGLLFGLGILIVSAFLLYTVGLLIFYVAETGFWMAPAFGSRGLAAMFRSAPWFLILFSAAFVVVLEILVRKYEFAYRKPLLYSIVGILIAVILGGALIVPLHRKFIRDDRAVPGMPRRPMPMFMGADPRFSKEIHRGLVLATTTDGFEMKELPGEDVVRVAVSAETRMPRRGYVSVGMEVGVLGERIDNEIRALGVRPIKF